VFNLLTTALMHHKYRKEIDKKLEDGLQSLRMHEEQINLDRMAFEKEVLDKAERTSNLDREMLKRHQNRLAEYEKHLVAKFNMILEEYLDYFDFTEQITSTSLRYRTRVATDVEFHFSKRRQVCAFSCWNIHLIFSVSFRRLMWL
jgi:hypothetical protein